MVVRYRYLKDGQWSPCRVVVPSDVSIKDLKDYISKDLRSLGISYECINIYEIEYDNKTLH